MNDTNHRSTDSRNGSGADSAFDVAKMLTPMFEFGAAMLRMQERMFATLLGTKDAEAPKAHDTRADEQDAEQDHVDPPKLDEEPSQAIGVELNDVVAIRAEQISRAHPAGDPVGNWLLAEQEVLAEREMIALRAGHIAASPEAQGDVDNWLRAEYELSAAGGDA